MNRRSLTSALAAVVLGLSVALVPAASASAAGNGSITVHNNCGRTESFTYYRSGQLQGGGQMPASGRISLSLAPGTYVVTTIPRYTTVTVRSGQGWAVRLCN